MDRARFRDLLQEPGSYRSIAAASAGGTLSPILPVHLFPHIGDVYRRLEAAAGEDGADIMALRVAVLVHEEPADRLPHLLATAGVGDLAPTVTAVVGGFGQLWKARGDVALTAYVATHRTALRSLLLFELAHEGRPIPRMEQAAALGGLADAFQRWVARLANEETSAPVR